MTEASPAHLLYLGAYLPKRSETFVFREVLGLRARGIRVTPASVHLPERDLGDAVLDELAVQAVVVYRRRMLLDALCGALWRPAVALRGLLDALTAPDVRLLRRHRVLAQLMGGLGLAWRLRHEGLTHVHAHMAHVPATVAMYAAAALGIPWSFTGHAADLFRDRQMLPTKLRRAAATVCISRWHRDYYRQWADLPDERLPVVRCGVDLDGFRPGSGGGGLLSVGRLTPKKGFDILIRALAVLVGTQGPEAGGPHLTLIGDGPERDRLEQLTDRLGMRERVSFAGAGTEQQVREAMRLADVFTLPCRISADGDRDGIPVVLMEAMACGVPVVCGDLPTIRELIVDPACGVLVDQEDPEALARELGRLLEDPSRRAAIGKAGRARVADEFSLDETLDRLIRCFDRARSASVREPA
ncbi:MAG: glycosyltransferase family 4 protein [Planctomycetota bacterium]